MECDHFFTNLNSDDIASIIESAQEPICIASPGIQKSIAEALCSAAKKLGPELISVCVDFDEHVFRMGYADIEAIKQLESDGIRIDHSPGLRSGLVIVGDEGYVYTPTALYLEAEPTDVNVRNAVRLSKQQITEALSRMSPVAKAIAVMSTDDPVEKKRIESISPEVVTEEIKSDFIEHVTSKLKQAPPVKFDVVRQVRVFEPFLQYVDMSLSGAAIQRHKLKIPRELQELGGGNDLEGRLKTTFDLIAKGSNVSSKKLDDKLKSIRDNLTRSLGKTHGRVVLKAAKPLLEKRIAELRKMIDEHQENISSDLSTHLDDSRNAIINYYLPIVVENPPDELLGQSLSGKTSEDEARGWINRQLDRVFPSPESLLDEIKFDVRYKDITFETLNQDDFLESVKAAFKDSNIDWDKAYKEFMAAGQVEEKK